MSAPLYDSKRAREEAKSFLSPVMPATGCSLSQEAGRDCNYSPGCSKSHCLHVARAPPSPALCPPAHQLGAVLKGMDLSGTVPRTSRGRTYYWGTWPFCLALYSSCARRFCSSSSASVCRDCERRSGARLALRALCLTKSMLLPSTRIWKQRGGGSSAGSAGACRHPPLSPQETNALRKTLNCRCTMAHPQPSPPQEPERHGSRSYGLASRRNQCQEPLGCHDLPGIKSQAKPKPHLFEVPRLTP